MNHLDNQGFTKVISKSTEKKIEKIEHTDIYKICSRVDYHNTPYSYSSFFPFVFVFFSFL